MEDIPWIWVSGLGVALGLAISVWLIARAARRSSGARPAGKRLRGGLWSRLRSRLGEGRSFDAEARAALREAMVAADVGPGAADRLLERLQANPEAAPELVLEQAIAETLEPHVVDPDALPADAVVLIVGVNGAGKTTTIAKLTRRWLDAGRNVVLGAGDTFRAAAAEQLVTWGERLGVRVVRQAEGADPAAVAFDTVKAAEKAAATALIDTAGRIHGHQGLMQELAKVARVAGKARAGAPHAVWLVLDGSQGQTALEQARRFHAAVPLSGVIVTKLDGEGRGGFLLPLVEELGIGIVAVGLGETAEDFAPFEARAFARHLLHGSWTREDENAA